MGCKKRKKVVFSHFAECNGHDTRQSDHLGTTWEHALPSAMAIALGKSMANITDLPSATVQALGKGRHFAECRRQDTRQSSHLCRVSKSMALGKSSTFAECLTLTLGKAAVMVALAVTATFLCRVSDWHSAKPLPSARYNALGKEVFADKLFTKCPLPSVTLGKGFAECISAFAECLDTRQRSRLR